MGYMVMSDLRELLEHRDKRAFPHWDDFVQPDMIRKSEEAIRRLIDRLVALGREPSREEIQEEVDACIYQFNDLDKSGDCSWICTVEREDICEVLQGIVDLCGYDGSDEEWTRERDW